MGSSPVLGLEALGIGMGQTPRTPGWSRCPASSGPTSPLDTC